MHTYKVTIVPRDGYIGPYMRTMDVKADNLNNLRRKLLKEYGWELETEDMLRKLLLVIYKDQGHYVMSDWMGQLTTGNSPGVKWVTKKTAYTVNKDGSLGRRL